MSEPNYLFDLDDAAYELVAYLEGLASEEVGDRDVIMALVHNINEAYAAYANHVDNAQVEVVS
jgi:hypothetical protein